MEIDTLEECFELSPINDKNPGPDTVLKCHNVKSIDWNKNL